MYVLCMYTNIYLLCMIKARLRWFTCRVENILTLGKLLSLWFCFLLHSILFLISQTCLELNALLFTLSAHAREGYSSLSLCVSLFYFLEQ